MHEKISNALLWKTFAVYIEFCHVKGSNFRTFPLNVINITEKGNMLASVFNSAIIVLMKWLSIRKLFMWMIKKYQHEFLCKRVKDVNLVTDAPCNSSAADTKSCYSKFNIPVKQFYLLNGS